MLFLLWKQSNRENLRLKLVLSWIYSHWWWNFFHVADSWLQAVSSRYDPLLFHIAGRCLGRWPHPWIFWELSQCNSGRLMKSSSGPEEACTSWTILAMCWLCIFLLHPRPAQFDSMRLISQFFQSKRPNGDYGKWSPCLGLDSPRPLLCHWCELSGPRIVSELHFSSAATVVVMHLWPHQVVLAPGCPVVPLSQASLWPCLVEVEVSFWLCRTLAVIPVWVSHALCILWLQVVFHHSLHWCLGVVCLSQVAQIFCRIAQLLVVFAYTCVRSTQHHMLVIPEASVDDRHRPQEVWISQFN